MPWGNLWLTIERGESVCVLKGLASGLEAETKGDAFGGWPAGGGDRCNGSVGGWGVRLTPIG